MYGHNIDNINLLVGKNGTGKSTVLDIIGEPIKSKMEKFGAKNESSWFLLYHKDGRKFTIEGKNPYVINNFKNKDSIKHIYSIDIEYDMEKQKIKRWEFFKRFRNSAMYLYYRNGDLTPWMKKYRNFDDDSYIYSTINRIVFDDDIYENIVELIYNSNKSNYIFEHPIYGQMSVKLKTSRKEDFDVYLQNNKEYFIFAYLDEIARYIYGTIGKIQASTLHSKKDTFEDMIHIRLNTMANNIQSKLDTPLEVNANSQDSYDISESLTYIEFDFFLMVYILKYLGDIPEKCFVSEKEIKINFFGMDFKTYNSLKCIMWALDINQQVDHEINQRYYLNVDFGMSTGEAHRINLFASLYSLSRKYVDFTGTCILLLDEPDEHCHPEWSRSLIYDMCDVLTKSPFNRMKYQIIITTHSPMLLSDVPQCNIHYMRKEKDGAVTIRKSNHGFMGNIHDLLTDPFFVDSLFGKFAELYTKETIRFIKELEKNSDIPCDKLIEINKRIKIIDDDFIKRIMESKLQVLKRG